MDLPADGETSCITVAASVAGCLDLDLLDDAGRRHQALLRASG
jgi:hypothetical protein